jgi:hypothetical protein
MLVIGSVRLVGTNTSGAFRSASEVFDRKTDGNQDGNGQW